MAIECKELGLKHLCQLTIALRGCPCHPSNRGQHPIYNLLVPSHMKTFDPKLRLATSELQYKIIMCPNR
jgi:hypothetical protein